MIWVCFCSVSLFVLKGVNIISDIDGNFVYIVCFGNVCWVYVFFLWKDYYG